MCSFILILFLFIRVYFYYKHADEFDEGYYKNFMIKMIHYSISLVSIVIMFIIFFIKEKNFIFWWILSGKVMECLLGIISLFVFGVHSKILNEFLSLLLCTELPRETLLSISTTFQGEMTLSAGDKSFPYLE